MIVNNIAKFKSILPNIDVSTKNDIESINNIMKEFNIIFSDVVTVSMIEKEASALETDYEKVLGYDVPNKLSDYVIILKNQNIASLIKKLRTFSIVRECNFNYPATSD